MITMVKNGFFRRAVLTACISIAALIAWWGLESNNSGISFFNGSRIFLIALLGVIFTAYVVGILSRSLSVAFSVTTVFVWWFVTNQDWATIGIQLKSADLACIAAALACSAAGCVLRALRWQLMMRPVVALPFKQSLGATLIAMTGNNVLPFRAGEFIRPAFIKLRYSGNFTATFSTVVIERLFDLIGLGAVMAFVCIFWPIAPSSEAQNSFNSSQAALWLTIVITSILGFLILLKMQTERVKGAVAWIMTIFPGQVRQRAVSLIDSFVTGLSFADNAFHVLLTLIYSLAIWAVAAVFFYYCALAFNFHISFSGACFVLLCTSLAVALPQAPSFIGTFHWAATLAIQQLHMPEAAAASFAIISHAMAFIPATIAGFIALWLMGLHLRQVIKQPQASEELDKREKRAV